MGHQTPLFTPTPSSTAATSATTTTATYTTTSRIAGTSSCQSQDIESLETHIFDQFQLRCKDHIQSRLSGHSSKMSNPNQYGSQGGSSHRGTPNDRGKGSADQEILDGLLPRIETRGQSSRHRPKKSKDGKKKSGSSHKSVPPFRSSGHASSSASAGPSTSAPISSSEATGGAGAGVQRQEADTDTVEAPHAAAPLTARARPANVEARAGGEHRGILATHIPEIVLSTYINTLDDEDGVENSFELQAHTSSERTDSATSRGQGNRSAGGGRRDP